MPRIGLKRQETCLQAKKARNRHNENYYALSVTPFVSSILHLEQHTKLAAIAKARETQWNEKGTVCTGRPFF